MNDTPVYLLRAIHDELRLIRRALESGGPKAQRAAKRPDLDVLATILPSIAESVGVGVVFTSADLIEFAPNGSELCGALAAAFGADRKKAARQASELFRRCDGVASAGIAIKRAGHGRDGVLWEIATEGDDA